MVSADWAMTAVGFLARRKVLSTPLPRMIRIRW
jgi:hypothetical protein